MHALLVAAPEGLWIYTLNFPGQSQRIAHFPLQADLTPQMVEQLKPLIGFNTLLV